MTSSKKLRDAIRGVTESSKAAQVRRQWSEIERKIAAGVRVADIVRALNENGLEITLATLKSYLYRFRRQLSMSHESKAARSTERPAGALPEPPEDAAWLALAEAGSTSPGLLRHINMTRCLQQLRRDGTQSRAELAGKLGLTRATTGKAVADLRSAGLVRENQAGAAEQRSGRPGRPGSTVKLDPAGGYAIGIDIATHSASAVLLNLESAVVAKSALAARFIEAPVQVALDRIEDLVQRVVAGQGIDLNRLAGVCISIPGLVDHSGKIVIAPYLQWRDIPLKELLAAKLDRRWPIGVCNDAVALANAERTLGTNASSPNMLVMLLSEGLGGAIVQNGTVLPGAHGFAGELGHMVMAPNVAENDPKTLEVLAGYGAFSSYVPSRLAMAEGIRWLTNLSDEDLSTDLRRVFDRWAETLATGLLNLIYLLDPEHIVLGGPLSVLFPRIHARVNHILSGQLLYGYRVPRITTTSFGADGAAIGAATLMLDQVFKLPRL